MAPPIEIRSGLRKLEFKSAKGADSEAAQQAVVEFVRPTRLAQSDTVSVVLGLRDGVIRRLEGRAQFVETSLSSSGEEEYVYRLQGVIAAPPTAG
jgi:hypothetical protein